MLQEIDGSFKSLESKVEELLRRTQKLQTELALLEEVNQTLRSRVEEEKMKNQMLAEENKTVRMQAALGGNPEQSRLLKNHINRLIREVDFCIATLHNTNL